MEVSRQFQAPAILPPEKDHR